MKICFFTTGVFPVSADNVKAVENWTYGLAKSLKDLGHEIVIFGSAGSSKEFEIIVPRNSITADQALNDSRKYEIYINEYFEKCLDYCAQNSVDIIHDQTSILSILEKSKRSKVPVISTFHVIRDEEKNKEIYSTLNFLHNVSPSNYLAQASAPLKFKKIIPHGIDTTQFSFNLTPEDHFLFVGKIIETKGPIHAVMAANQTGELLQICGAPMAGEKNEKYYQDFLQQIEGKNNIKYLGKVDKKDVAGIMSNAKALIMSFTAPEAFGLVMIEALSCGTPVIAYNIGTAGEIVRDGVNGFLVTPEDVNGLAAAMKNIDKIDRRKCRETAELNFSHDIMVKSYLEEYAEVIRNETKN
jgi:glycosyltransferase involved in cell wall biosynthesis